MPMLDGIRIVDLSSVIFGPYATQMLADLGAEVIKIEAPRGDTPRYMGKFKSTPYMGGTHMTVNRGKKSIVLDLKQPNDAEVLRKLIASADIFVHNVRGRAIRKLGFGYDDVKTLRPDIIYAHFVGFGQDGPYADHPAYDDIIQAASGTCSLLPRVDGDERPRFLPSLIADKVAGTYGAQAMLAALVHKLRTGEGQHVEVPMLECFTNFILTEHLQDAVFDPALGPVGYARQLDPARQPFPTKDGRYIVIVPYSDPQVVKLLEMMGDATFLSKPPLDTPMGRFQNMTPIYARIGELTPAKTYDEWAEILRAEDYPFAEARDLSAVFDEPHLAATGFFAEVDHPSEGKLRAMRPPVRYSADREREIGVAPRLDEHGKEIRASLN